MSDTIKYPGSNQLNLNMSFENKGSASAKRKINSDMRRKTALPKIGGFDFKMLIQGHKKKKPAEDKKNQTKIQSFLVKEKPELKEHLELFKEKASESEVKQLEKAVKKKRLKNKSMVKQINDIEKMLRNIEIKQKKLKQAKKRQKSQTLGSVMEQIGQLMRKKGGIKGLVGTIKKKMNAERKVIVDNQKKDEIRRKQRKAIETLISEDMEGKTLEKRLRDAFKKFEEKLKEVEGDPMNLENELMKLIELKQMFGQKKPAPDEEKGRFEPLKRDRSKKVHAKARDMSKSRDDADGQLRRRNTFSAKISMKSKKGMKGEAGASKKSKTPRPKKVSLVKKKKGKSDRSGKKEKRFLSERVEAPRRKRENGNLFAIEEKGGSELFRDKIKKELNDIKSGKLNFKTFGMSINEEEMRQYKEAKDTKRGKSRRQKRPKAETGGIGKAKSKSNLKEKTGARKKEDKKGRPELRTAQRKGRQAKKRNQKSKRPKTAKGKSKGFNFRSQMISNEELEEILVDDKFPNNKEVIVNSKMSLLSGDLSITNSKAKLEERGRSRREKKRLKRNEKKDRSPLRKNKGKGTSRAKKNNGKANAGKSKAKRGKKVKKNNQVESIVVKSKKIGQRSNPKLSRDNMKHIKEETETAETPKERREAGPGNTSGGRVSSLGDKAGTEKVRAPQKDTETTLEVEIIGNSFDIEIEEHESSAKLETNITSIKLENARQNKVADMPEQHLLFQKKDLKASQNSQDIEQKLSQVEEKFNLDYLKNTNECEVRSELDPLKPEESPEMLKDSFIKKQLQPFNRKKLFSKTVEFDDNKLNSEIEEKVLRIGRDKATKIVTKLKTRMMRVASFSKQKNDSYVYPAKPKETATMNVQIRFPLAMMDSSKDTNGPISEELTPWKADAQTEELKLLSLDKKDEETLLNNLSIPTEEVLKNVNFEDIDANTFKLNSKKEVVINRILESGIQHKNKDQRVSQAKCMKVMESEYNSIPDNLSKS